MSWLDELSPKKRAIAGKVIAYARKHGVPENVALGMAMQESGFDQNKKSGTGPVGVMQVGKKASKDLKINPRDVDQNIEGGIRYFKQMLDLHGDVDTALVAYHDGPNSPFFKGGEMSLAAKNHIQKVKGYAGMADNTQSKVKVASAEDEFNVPLTEIKPLDFTTSSFAPPPPPTKGPRSKDITDVMAGMAGAGVGYAASPETSSMHKKELNLSAQRLAMKQQQQLIEEAEKAAARNAPPAYGSGTSKWKDTEYAEPIARQIVNPLDKEQAVIEAKKRIAAELKGKQMFPSQVPASPGSLLTIPVTTGGRATMPIMPPAAPPAPAPAQAPPLSQMPAMQALNAPGRGAKVASTALGGQVATQGYDAIRNLMEGNFAAAGQSGLSAAEAALAMGTRNPRVKALMGGISAATSYGPELLDYIKAYTSGGELPPEEAPPVNRAEGGLAQYGLLHSGQGAKGKGYFGPMSSQDIGDGGPVDYSLGAQPYSTELSAENDEYEYPTMVPGLTREELDHLRAGHEPTDDIIRKAEAHAEKRRASGRSPFSQPDELRYPVPNMAGGKLVGDALKKSLAALADRYPNMIPGVMKMDKKKGEEYLAKALSPEEKQLQAARNAAQKDIEAGNYSPYFDVEKRFHVDPANYPLTGSTLVDAMPKTGATAEKWRQKFDTPEVRGRLHEAYGAAKDDPLTHTWYGMGQLEEAFIKELGPEAGRKAFKERFAVPMAATTGGADPTANLLSAYYGNFMRQAGKPMGASSVELPHPIGGRYIMGNIGQYDKIINKGGGLTTATPKRFNFASNFMGHTKRPTLDEQMSGIYDPALKAPPGDSYGVMERILNDAAAREGVSPVNFQEVAWAGRKGVKGKPMMQHVNEAIERTSRVTGKSPQDVLRDSLIHARSPLYGGAVGAGGLSQYEDQK